MKLHKYMFASLSFCSLVLGSCQNNDIDDEHHYDNKVFVTSQQVRDDLLIKETISEATRSISYRLADPLDREVNISFDAAPQLIIWLLMITHRFWLLIIMRFRSSRLRLKRETSVVMMLLLTLKTQISWTSQDAMCYRLQ